MHRNLSCGAVALFVLGSVACSSSSDGDKKDELDSKGTGGALPSTNAGAGGALPPVGSGGAVSVMSGAGGTTTQVVSSGGAPPVASGGTPPVASGGSPPVGAGGGTTITPTGTTCLKPAGDFSKNGPYQVAKEQVDLGANIDPKQATGKFTIFYPQPFEASCQHPVVAWGNGTGVTGPDIYGFFNQNAASWGVVVIAAEDSNTGSGNYHKKGLDYMMAQNEDAQSKYYHKLSKNLGVSGHSQGGFGAAQAASYPGVKALVPVGASGTASANLGFLCLTGTKDIAPDACKTAVNAAKGPALAAIWDGGDHTGTETLAGYVSGDKGTIQMMRLYAAWFRCYLADDGEACKMFTGAPATCGICKDPGWSELVAKNL